MALVFPLLLMVMFGIIQCGILFNNWVLLTDAVRAGSRQLAISRAPGQDGCQLAVASVQRRSGRPQSRKSDDHLDRHRFVHQPSGRVRGNAARDLPV